jgi:hypothetical protein
MIGEFYQLSRAWYGKAYMEIVREREPQFIDDVMFSASNCEGECRMAWYDLGLGKPSPCLEIYSGSWEYFEKHPTLFKMLAQLPGIQPEEFCRFLKKHGFRDVTPEHPPHKREEVTG